MSAIPNKREPGDVCFFEYHCYEGEDSADAEVWHRTHQQVEVLALCEPGIGATPQERGNNGAPAVYRVKWLKDGFVYDAWEDELLDSEDDYERPGYKGRNR